MSKHNSNYGNTKGNFYNEQRNSGKSESQINNAWHRSDTKSDAVNARDFKDTNQNTGYTDYADQENDY